MVCDVRSGSHGGGGCVQSRFELVLQPLDPSGELVAGASPGKHIHQPFCLLKRLWVSRRVMRYFARGYPQPGPQVSDFGVLVEGSTPLKPLYFLHPPSDLPRVPHHLPQQLNVGGVLVACGATCGAY